MFQIQGKIVKATAHAFPYSFRIKCIYYCIHNGIYSFQNFNNI